MRVWGCVRVNVCMYEGGREGDEVIRRVADDPLNDFMIRISISLVYDTLTHLHHPSQNSLSSKDE